MSFTTFIIFSWPSIFLIVILRDLSLFFLFWLNFVTRRDAFMIFRLIRWADFTVMNLMLASTKEAYLWSIVFVGSLPERLQSLTPNVRNEAVLLSKSSIYLWSPDSIMSYLSDIGSLRLFATVYYLHFYVCPFLGFESWSQQDIKKKPKPLQNFLSILYIPRDSFSREEGRKHLAFTSQCFFSFIGLFF